MPATSDFLLTTISENKNIHGYFCNIKNSLNILTKKHNLNNISKTILSRAMVGTVLLSGNLKNKNDYISIIWDCTGEAKKIFCESFFNGDIRGYIIEKNLGFIEESFKNDFLFSEPYIGFGELKIMRQTFDNRAPYSSVVPIETGEIAQDISIYLDQVLQIQSALKIGLSVTEKNHIESAGGLLLMAMPGAKTDELNKIYEEFNKLLSLTDILKKENMEIHELFKNLGLDIINVKNIQAKCRCDKNKILKILKTLDLEEIKKYGIDDKTIETECQYCSKKYCFSIEEITD